MATPVIQSSFVTGEVSPSLFGNVALTRMHAAASTMRNFFVRFSGGAYSRAGTAYAAFSKQTGRQFPPRMIPFQFNINQGLALEFGNFYMRVFFDGAAVTEAPFSITGITKANPGVVSYQNLSSAGAGTPNNGGITVSYVRGDTITIAGGASITPATFQINNTTIAKLSVLSGGSGYAPGDQLTLAVAAGVTPPVLTVLTVSGGAIVTFAISTGGIFTTNQTGTFTVASTTGIGTGATFQNAIYGASSLSVFNAGSYTAIPSNPANQASTSGSGVGMTVTVTWQSPGALVNGDWVFIQGAGGMVPINGETYVISGLTGTSAAGTFQLLDVFGNTIDSTSFPAYTSGGTASRIFTLSTPYAEADLKYLKFTQSADVMTLCCVNQQTGTEYPAQDLARITDTNWTFSSVVGVPSIGPPASLAVSASPGGTNADYHYVVTAVSPVDGTESIASPIGDVQNVNIAATAGNNVLQWTGVANVNEYNIYKATPVIGGTVPPGVQFGFAGSAYGLQFVDSNIVADFSQVPPTHQNPFARGQILSVLITNGGSGGSFTYTITSSTGSGAVLQTVALSSTLATVIVQDSGQNYLPTDTITFNNGATGTLVVGPQTGTYPGVVAYFQQRRAYAATINQPDTYFMSQPGAFLNFDTRIPTIATDAIIGTPWSVEVNGIQFMVPITGGLIVMTGLEAYLLGGAGSSVFTPQPLTPSSQQAEPQGFNGCSATVPPVRIYQDIVYVQAKGATYRDFSFQLSSYTFTGLDLTINSTHLFTDFEILEHAWCEEPYRLLWVVRSDGVLLSLTYMKEQQVMGWARHDTNGLFQSVCSVTEPPIDALYLAAQRQFGTNMCYTIERMDSRLWTNVEEAWCVDCGFTLAQPQPNATLSASSSTGLGSVTGATGIVGGSGYSSAATATVVDAPLIENGPNGPGTGAVPTLTFVGGVLTNVTFSGGNQGSGYLNPQLVIFDPAGSEGGSGASAVLTLNNTMTFSASSPVFSVGNVGSVIRMGGGVATITGFVDTQHVTANITTPIAGTQPNGSGAVQSAPAGDWSMTVPITTVNGLRPLAGMTVTGLADGIVIPPMVVNSAGQITLSTPASQITIGLAFQAQLQSVYVDAGEPTVQGQRKKIPAVTARVEASGRFLVGCDQPDGSTLSPPQIAPTWSNLSGANTPATAPYNSRTIPLCNADIRIPVQAGWQKPGQVCIQQNEPLPVQVLAFIPELLGGDVPSQSAPKRGQAA